MMGGYTLALVLAALVVTSTALPAPRILPAQTLQLNEAQVRPSPLHPTHGAVVLPVDTSCAAAGRPQPVFGVGCAAREKLHS